MNISRALLPSLHCDHCDRKGVRMKLKLLAFWLCAVAMTLAAGDGIAQSASLNGPRVITLPYVYVPFLRSETVIQQGRRNTATGQCVFSPNLSIRPNQLGPNEALASIQRAIDPDTCQELVEKGVIIKGSPAPTSDLEILRGSGRLALASSAPTATAATYVANGQTWFTDGNNPVVRPFRSLTNGIEASRSGIQVSYQTGDCVSTFPAADYSWETRWFSFTG